LTFRRHARFVRVTHWLTSLAFAALLLSGVEVLLSHPLFIIPVPASRSTVPTGYDYVLPDQNGWSRYLHFESAWLLGFSGLAYLVAGVRTGHFRRNLMPAPADLRWGSVRRSIAEHLRFSPAAAGDPESYNLLQRLTYLVVIFALVPFVIWTGLAMSPGFAAIWPPVVTLLGGKQTARTLHFAVSVVLVLFLIVHLGMLAFAGFTSRVRAMITGHSEVRS
jgi:thiosulfate reductase cytochrome b subunit